MHLALERWPDLRLVESKPELVDAGGHLFVSVTVTVWRTPDDPIPCTATAWEPFPGRTSFTKDSEMMNASTSAAGRCLGLMGIGLRSSIASANEVRHRQPERTERSEDQTKAIPRVRIDSAPPATEKQRSFIQRLAAERGIKVEILETMTVPEAKVMIDELMTKEKVR
jgi:hypothetical protein